MHFAHGDAPEATGGTGNEPVMGGNVKVLSYATALPVLTAHGLEPGTTGFDVGDLYAVAGDRGWVANVERGTAAGSSRRWRASVFAHKRTATNPTAVRVGGTTGHGPTEAEALAVALGACCGGATPGNRSACG